MLTSNKKEQRKRALKEHLLRLEDSEVTQEIIRKIFDEENLQLVNILNDPVEACRDLAVDVLQRYFTVLPPEERDLNYVIPTLYRRLGCQERVEVSEEVRLKCIYLLKTIISRYQSYISIYTDCLTQIFAQSLLDNYPIVKKECCECVCMFAKSLPSSVYSQLERLVKPTISNISHRHYKVRVTGVRTIGNLMMYLSANTIEEVTSALAERLFDQNGLVREAVVEVAGKWLVQLPHRYGYFHKILPLLLTGLHDTVEEVRTKSAELWDTAGKQYLKENENDEKLKDKMDYLTEPPTHYPSIIRPNLGCRILAQQNFSKLINGIGVELVDWKSDIRVRSAQLLCVFILHLEEHITQHIEKILPFMYRASNDENKVVGENIELTAEYIGYFVSPSIYCDLVLPTIEESPTAGHFRVLSAILRGSNSNLLMPKIKEIGNFLSQPHLCQSRKADYQMMLLACCKSLFDVCQLECQQISEDLYTVIFTVLSMAANQTVKKEAEDLLAILATNCSCGTTQDLHYRYARQLLLSLTNSESWTIHTPDSLILSSFITKTISAITTNADVVLPILKTTLSTESDPELRLKYFIHLSECFSNNDEKWESPDVLQFIRNFIETCIIENLVWTAGRSAEAIRTSVVCCLCGLLFRYQTSYKRIVELNPSDAEEPNSDQFFSTLEKIVPILISLMDDNAIKTRLYSLEAISILLSIMRDENPDLQNYIHQVYPIVLKRLDDGSDDVRIQAVRTITKVWSFVPKDYDIVFNRVHVDTLYMTMIIHLDDSDPEFRDLAYENLMELAKIHPELLHQKLQTSMPKFQNPDKIEELIIHCQDILKNSKST